MNISKALPGTVTLEYQDEEWAQTIDYEHIPFRCRKCHEHGHLFRDCTLNVPPKREAEEKSKEGFTQAQNRRRQAQKNPTTNNEKNNPNNNSFESLNRLPEAEEVENPHKTAGKDPSKHKEDHPSQEYQTPANQADPQTHPVSRKEPEREEDKVMEMDEHDLAEIDLDRLEEALKKKDLQTLLEDQLRKFHKFFLDSSAGATSRLGISTDPNQDPRKHPKENKRRGRRSAHQLIKEAGNYMINSRQIHRLSESSFSHPPNC
jgi:hypothetical protein